MTDTRNSALFKRAEQLKRWEESETNRQSASPKKASRIKFSSGCVFLAACTAGDKEEVLRLLQSGADINTANVDGLTALHQACIDDNLDMVEFLVARGADVDRGDNEGWTPLHATASCGFLSIARFLLDSGADVAAVNYDGELPIDIAESDQMAEMLHKVIREKGVDVDSARNAEERTLLADAKQWATDGYKDVHDPKTGGTPLHVAAAKGYIDVARVLLEDCGADPDCVDFDGWTPLHAAALWGQKEAAAALIHHGAAIHIKNYSGQTCLDLVEPNMSSWLKDMCRNNNNNSKKRPHRAIQFNIADPPPEKKSNSADGASVVSVAPSGVVNAADENEEPPVWRRSASLRARLSNDTHNETKPNETNTKPATDDSVLRRTHSFENDKTFYERYCNVTARIKASSCPSVLPPPINLFERLQQRRQKTSPPESPVLRVSEKKEREANTWSGTTTTTTFPTTTPPATPSPSTPSASPAGSQSPGTPMRRSFVPPTRDEESETQRKAHAKRVRETRRSTQGVTLDEIKSAEQLVRKKPAPSNSENARAESGNGVPAATVEVANTTTSATIAANNGPERRPTWRLRVDPGCKFELEDASGTTAPGSPRPSSPRLTPTPVVAQPSVDTSVTLTLRPPPAHAPAPPPSPTHTNNIDKEDEKEGDKSGAVGGGGSTQAALNVIQRRRRPKRRSTGVGNIDPDAIEGSGERGAAGEDSEGDASQSGSERTSDVCESKDAVLESTGSAGGGGEKECERETDYRALWKASQQEVARLRELLSASERQARDSRATIARLTQVNQNSLTELEKREKRAMERKLSEMEEELKGLQALQAENARLKDENGALIRVISKLSK